MILFPAIDLKDGVCVRLKKGAMDEATVFNTDPAAQARSFAQAGFRWLHCVDLNGAFEGRSANADAIKSIRAAIDLPIQLGGGIRDRAAVEAWLDAGITRVILGTAALTDPDFVKDAARAHPGRIVWTPDLTAAKAIQSAGGFSLYAKETAVSLVREKGAYTIDVKLAQKDPTQEPRLMPGDSLQVPRSPF